jgi:hypothetical protein
MSGFDHIQKEAIHGIATTAKNITDAGTTILGMLLNNKKLKVSITSAKDSNTLKDAAKSAIAAGATPKEVSAAIKDNPLAQKSKDPEKFAQGMAVAGVIARANEVVPQQSIQKQRKQSMSK